MNIQSPPQDLTVLLVDDDPAILRMLARWLERAGYRVQTASDGAEALARIETGCPDILVTDWEMPRLDGLELCRELRSRTLPHYLYIVFLTVRSDSHAIVAGLDVGADEFLTKPVQPEELLARLRAGERVIQLERRLSWMARTDSLTGLLTQGSFHEVLRTEWERSRRHSLCLACVMADIDYFKRVNDIHGHPAGDAVLRSVAELLKRAGRNSDSVCRYGGEEFCILLPQTTEEQAVLWAERARNELAGTTFPTNWNPVQVTASFGVAQTCDGVRTCGQLVDLADQALRVAKQSGRNRVVGYQSLNAPGQHGAGTSHGADLLAGVSAGHVMTPLIAALHETESVGAAVEFFLRMRINSTPVVDDSGKLTGILSEKDLMAAMVSVNFWRLPVREVMKPHVICYDEETPIRLIYEFLCRVAIRRVVITRGAIPVGTISRGTLLRWFRNLVFSKGLVSDPEASLGPASRVAVSSKERLTETADELAHLATHLESRFREEAANPISYAVGGATRIQELVIDLLIHSRFANASPAETGAAAQALLFDCGSLD